MTETTGIRQSVTRAWRLLNETGFMHMSRGLHTESFQVNVREAVRELREAASDLVRSGNQGAYGELNEGFRLTLWKSILLARAPATGQFIIANIGGVYPDMSQDVHEADRTLSSNANGFPVWELHRITARILDSAPDRRTTAEQAAARQGDPMPSNVTTAEAQLYQRIVLRAIQQSSREASSHRNAGDAALEAFGQSFLPALPNTSDGIHGMAQDQIEGKLAEALSRGGETAVRESAYRIGAIVSVIRAVLDASDAHYRATHPDYRLNHWIHQGCLAECHDNNAAALNMMHALQNIRQRMNNWMEWLQRHQDHPSYVPPSGRLDPGPTASLATPRTGAAMQNGPVQGSVRGYASRGPLGLG